MARRDATSQAKSQLEVAIRNVLKETHTKARLRADLTAVNSRLDSLLALKSELEAASIDALLKIQRIQSSIEAETKLKLANLYEYISEARAANSRLISNSEQDLSKTLTEAKKRLESSMSCLSDSHTRLHALYCITCGSSLQTSCRLCKAIRN